MLFVTKVTEKLPEVTAKSNSQPLVLQAYIRKVTKLPVFHHIHRQMVVLSDLFHGGATFRNFSIAKDEINRYPILTV